MDNKDIIILMLAAIAMYQTYKLEQMTEKYKIADYGWWVALMYIREHNVPLPTSEECDKYLRESGRL